MTAELSQVFKTRFLLIAALSPKSAFGLWFLVAVPGWTPLVHILVLSEHLINFHFSAFFLFLDRGAVTSFKTHFLLTAALSPKACF